MEYFIFHFKCKSSKILKLNIFFIFRSISRSSTSTLTCVIFQPQQTLDSFILRRLSIVDPRLIHSQIFIHSRSQTSSSIDVYPQQILDFFIHRRLSIADPRLLHPQTFILSRSQTSLSIDFYQQNVIHRGPTKKLIHRSLLVEYLFHRSSSIDIYPLRSNKIRS